MNRRQHLSSLFACVLAACGGGGDDVGDPGSASPVPSPAPPAPTPPAPQPDPVAPAPPAPAFAVSAFAPAVGSVAPRAASVSVTFNAEVAPGSVGPATVQLLGPQGNAIECALSCSGSVVQLEPKAALPADTRYTVAVGAAVADIAGRALGAAAQGAFTTTAAAWAAHPAVLERLTSYTGQTYPAAVALPSGDVMVVWTDFVDGAERVFAARWSAGQAAWSSPETVHVGTWFGRALRAVSIAACRDGDVVLFWAEPDSERNGQVRGARWSAAAGQWRSLGLVQVAPAGSVTSTPAVSVSAQGDITLVTHNVGLYAVRWRTGLGWSTPQRIDGVAGTPYILGVQTAACGANDVVAAWIQDDGAGRSPYVARYDAAADAWRVPERAGTNAQQYLCLATDLAGAVTLAWATGASLSSNPTLWSSRWSPQSPAWSPQRRVDRDGSFTGPGMPSLAVDGAGCATLAWMQDGFAFASRLDPRGGLDWSTPRQVSAAYTGGARRIALAADVAGNVALALCESENRPTAYRYEPSSGQWVSSVGVGRLEAGETIFANDPAAAVDPSGDVTLAWYAWTRTGGLDTYVLHTNRMR